MKEVTFFSKSKYSFSFNLFHVMQGTVAFGLILFCLFSVSNYFFPKQKTVVADSQIIKSSNTITKQTSAIVAGGKPVSFVTFVKKEDITNDQHFLKLPKNASHIKTTIITKPEAPKIIATATPQPKNKIVNNVFSKLSFALASLQEAGSEVIAEVVETITDQQSEVIQTPEAVVVDLQEQAPAETSVELGEARPPENSSESSGEVGPLPAMTTPDVEPTSQVQEIKLQDIGDLNKDGSIDELDFSVYMANWGKPSQEELTQQETTQEQKVEEIVKVEYEIPAPVITEQETSTGKQVVISAPDESQEARPPENLSESSGEVGPPTTSVYTNVLAHTTIPEIYKLGQEDKIKIKWKNENNQEVEFHAYDTNNNGKLDYVEWTVPHLSEQIFEIIFISKAFELDENKEIISDIYDQTKEKEGTWQDGTFATVTENHFVRVTFQQVLGNTNDITVYARSTVQGVQNVQIEVYPVYADVDGNLTQGAKLELVNDNVNPDFSNITTENKYRILLQNLQTPTDMFDLKIIGASVGFDFIVDPNNRYWVGGTGNWSDATNHWATSSNGSPGAGNLPATGDSVYFDANSGTGTVTIDSATISVTNFVTTGSSNSLTYTINSGVSFTSTGTITIISGSTITNNGIATIASLGAGTGTWTQGTNSTLYYSSTSISPILNATASGNKVSYTANGNASVKGTTYYNLDIGVSATLTADRTYNLNGSVTTVTGVCIIGPVSGNYTLSIMFSGASNQLILSGNGTPLVVNAKGYIPVDVTTGVFKYSGTAVNVAPINYNSLTLIDSAIDSSDSVFTFTAGSTYGVAGAFTVSGNNINDGVNMVSSSPGTQYNINITGSSYVSWVDVTDSNASGLAIRCNTTINHSNTSNWTFYYARFWVGGTGNWSDDDNHWATSSGGTPGDGNIPATGDSVYFDANSGTGTVTIDTTTVSVTDFNTTGVGALNFTINSDVNFTSTGTLTIITGRTITNNGTATIATVASYGTLKQGANSILYFTVSRTGGILNATASGNTVSYIKGDGYQELKNTTYYNLKIGVDSILTADTNYTMGISGNVTVTNVLTLGQTGTSYISTISPTSYTLTLSGSGTPFVINSYNGSPTGIINYLNTGSVAYTGSSSVNITNTNYGNLTLNKSGTTFNFTGPNTIYKNLTVTSGTLNPAGYQITGSGTNTLSITGTANVDATNFTDTYNSFETVTLNSNSTINYSKAGDQTIDNTLSYKSLAVSGSGTKTLGGDTTVATNLTVSAGTLATNNYNLNVAGNWTNSVGNSGFTAGTGTVTLNGTNQKIFGDTTFYNLTKDISAASAYYLYFQQGNTQSIADNGTLTLKGASGKTLTLRGCNSAGTLTSGNPKWGLNVSNTNTTLAIDYVDVMDSDASSGKAITHTNVTDSGNTLNWGFVPTDSTAPTTTAPATANGNSYIFGNWANANVAVTLSCTDNDGGVGCASGYPKYCTDTTNTCTPTTTYLTAVTISDEGTNYIRYYSQDTIPNIEPIKSSTIKIDKTAPTTSDDFTSNNTWASSNQTITLTPIDTGGSGIAWTKYCIDANNSCDPSTGTSYTTPITISTEGTSYFRYASQDNAGNMQITQSKTIKIDKQKPTTTADAGIYNFGEWSNYDVQVNLSCVDGSGSGCSTILYCQDKTNTCSPSSIYTNSIVISDKGENYIRYYSTDNVSNAETIKSQNVKLLSPGGNAIAVATHATPQQPQTQPQPQSIIKQITKQITSILPQKTNYPPIAESVPQEPQTALQGLKIMEINPLSKFGLVPIESDISFFARKIPQVKKALDALQIDPKKIDSLSQLAGRELYLPGLSKVGLLKNIPSDIVFARTAGGLIDFNTTILVDKSGQVSQKIYTISGVPLNLVMKSDKPVSRITGLITLVKSSTDQEGLLLQKFDYKEVEPSIFTADISAPVREGEYEIATVVEYKDSKLLPTETRLKAIVNPEGYVYKQTSDGRVRIENAQVSLYWYNPQSGKYELWQADQFLQKNPQTTNVTGKYSFLVPEGSYYIEAKAKKYLDYKSEIFTIKEDKSVNFDIEMKKTSFANSIYNFFTNIWTTKK